MKPSTLLLALAFALLAVSLTAEAQQPEKIPRIGLLWPGLSAAPSPLREAFLDGLHELGYVEGRTIVIEYRYAEGKDERLSHLASDLIQMRLM